MSHKETMERVGNALSLFEKAKSILNTDNQISYSLERMREYVDALFNRFAPWKIGDRVVLTETPVITNDIAWGWLGYKHIIKKGATATVDSVDYYSGEFVASIKFDKNTYINQDGKEMPGDKSFPVFHMAEHMIRKV